MMRRPPSLPVLPLLLHMHLTPFTCPLLLQPRQSLLLLLPSTLFLFLRIIIRLMRTISSSTLLLVLVLVLVLQLLLLLLFRHAQPPTTWATSTTSAEVGAAHRQRLQTIRTAKRTEVDRELEASICLFLTSLRNSTFRSRITLFELIT